MAAFTANQVTVSNGQKNIVINSNEAPEGVSKGDFIGVASFSLMEINRTYVDSNNKHVIELVKNWDNSNQSNQPAIVIPTTANFKQTADALIKANILINDNTQAMQDWQTKSGTVTFNNIDGTTTTVKTLKQIEVEAQDQMDATHPYPWSMRKAEFEANRAQNNELYAASGFVHFGKMRDGVSGTFAVGEGLFAKTLVESVLALGFDSNVSGAVGDSKIDCPVVNISGAITKIKTLSFVVDNGENTAKFPPAEDGTRTYDSATGVSVTHATPAIAFASETETNKVVTDRVDMWGLEAFLREINDADPFVYKNGLIQSLAPDINGVSTVTDNVRPDTYLAWYAGDDSSTGKGVNWQTASESDRAKIASDPDNNIFFDDVTGKFYQWCVRGRSFAGLGNGDWAVIENKDGTGSNANRLSYSADNQTIYYTRPQGGSDAPSGSYYMSDKSTYNVAPWAKSPDPAIYKQRGLTSAVDGECYFLVCGTVNRLNQGAYHPSFNPSGAGSFRVNSAYKPWHSVVNVLGYSIASKSQCFDFGSQSGQVGAGRINYRGSGREDGRSYEAIYASGQGGVCRDMRYSAWGLTQEDFSDADLKVKSGEYRGRGALINTKIVQLLLGPNNIRAVTSEGEVSPYNTWENGLVLMVAETVSGTGVVRDNRPRAVVLRNPEGGSLTLRSHPNKSGIRIESYIEKGLYIGDVASPFVDEYWEKFPEGASFEIYLFYDNPIPQSISGEYTHTEVIGGPANILLCDDLKDGITGSYNPIIPDGVIDTFPLTRPLSGGDVELKVSTDNGVTWSVSTVAIGSTPNTLTGTIIPEGAIAILSYKTKATMTERAANSEVMGGRLGVGDVFSSSSHGGNSGGEIGFSLISKTLTSNNGIVKPLSLYGTYKLNNYNLLYGRLSSARLDPEHSPLLLPAPNNSSPAFKALNYNTVENQQGLINYAYTELKYDGDWGDDSKIHIADNQTTMLDENGHTVLVGTARTVEPLGWIKNDK